MNDQQSDQAGDQPNLAIKLEVSREGLQAMITAVVPLLYDIISPMALREVTFRSRPETEGARND